MRMPGLAKLDPDMRQLVLFDRATGARDLGVMFVLDENGDVVEDAAASPPRKGKLRRPATTSRRTRPTGISACTSAAPSSRA